MTCPEWAKVVRERPPIIEIILTVQKWTTLLFKQEINMIIHQEKWKEFVMHGEDGQ